MTLSFVPIDAQVSVQACDARDHQKGGAAAFFSFISKVLPDQTGRRPVTIVHL